MLGLKAAESRPQPRPVAAPAPAIPGQRGRGIPIAELTALLAAAGFARPV
jgi:hypothetical protein